MTLKKNGKKLYPVCTWMKNQHKLYNYNDKMYIKMVESGYSDEDVKAFEEAERLLDVFEGGLHRDGLVYAEYSDYKIIKDIIGYYDLTH